MVFFIIVFDIYKNVHVQKFPQFFGISFSFIYIQMSKTLSVRYYQETKEILQQKAHERYQKLSNKEKEKMQQYH